MKLLIFFRKITPFFFGMILGLILTDRCGVQYKEVPTVVKDTVNIKEVEQVIEVQEVIKYSTDTVYTHDTVVVVDSSQYHTYNYTEENDTVAYHLAVCSKEEPLWYKLQCKHSNKLSIIQTADSVFVQSSNSVITGVSTKRKENWKSKFKPTIGIGVGYGLTNRKVDVYVGAGIGYTF